VTGVSIVPIVITLLVPIVTAMAGIFGVMIQDWRVRKSQAGRRKLALEDASRQVSFAVDWWNAKKLIAESPGAMQEITKCADDWLEEASKRVIGSKPPAARQRSPVTLRRLLLLYPLQGWAANIIRGFFYVSLAVLILGVGQAISDTLEPSSQHYLPGDIAGLIFVAILTLIFRFWAASAQNLNTGNRRTWPSRLRRALLLYRLHSASASLIRIIFYAWVVFWGYVVLTNVSGVQENMKSFPVVFAGFIAFTGLAVGLRYWAASLARTPDTGKANDQDPAETTVFVAEEASAKNWWESLPDQNRLQGHWRQS
jgi:hypothetical protein